MTILCQKETLSLLKVTHPPASGAPFYGNDLEGFRPWKEIVKPKIFKNAKQL